MVYSTCTLAPEEDEGVLDTILRQTGGAVTITEAGQRLGIHAPGLTEAFGMDFSPETGKSLRLWPYRSGTSGFFAAHLRKISSLPGHSIDCSTRPFVHSHLFPLSRKDQDSLSDFFNTNYGCVLNRILEEQNLTLVSLSNHLCHSNIV